MAIGLLVASAQQASLAQAGRGNRTLGGATPSTTAAPNG